MPLPIGFQGIGDSWRKKRTAFVATLIRPDRFDMIQKLCQGSQTGADRMALDYR